MVKDTAVLAATAGGDDDALAVLAAVEPSGLDFGSVCEGQSALSVLQIVLIDSNEDGTFAAAHGTLTMLEPIKEVTLVNGSISVGQSAEARSEAVGWVDGALIHGALLLYVFHDGNRWIPNTGPLVGDLIISHTVVANNDDGGLHCSLHHHLLLLLHHLLLLRIHDLVDVSVCHNI